jgi:hypothetical protein
MHIPKHALRNAYDTFCALLLPCDSIEPCTPRFSTSLYARYWGADAAARISSNQIYRPKPLPLDMTMSGTVPLFSRPLQS